MAEGFLKSFDPSMEIDSAGTSPGWSVHPLAIEAMKEIGIDISHGRPKNVDEFVRESFDYVITVCDHARETCPAFTGSVKHRLHMGFDDPTAGVGSPQQLLSEFRRVRDEIRTAFQHLYSTTLAPRIANPQS
jgi:arsenate reductase